MTHKRDEDTERWRQQRKERGFDERELWNLHYTIAKFIVPRLKAFIEFPSHPVSITKDEWKNILVEMLDGFEEFSRTDILGSQKDYEKTERSLALLKDWFFDLWH